MTSANDELPRDEGDEVDAGSEETLGRDEVRLVSLRTGEDGRPRQALVLLGRDGKPRGYLNRCKHLPIPLDTARGTFLTRDGRYLMCKTHGAIFQRDDGLCIGGPCEGASLDRVEVVQRDGRLWVRD